jgi:choline dehydrogenase-like flavoprotein
MIYVIGSGPSGVAVSKALLQKNLKVTMLDYGLDLVDSKKLVKKNSLSKHFIRKKIWGSDFPYINMNKNLTIHPEKYFISNAIGGLSNVWGAAILPFNKNELKKWPSKTKNLNKYYKKILNFIPSTIPIDGISEYYNFKNSKIENYNYIDSLEEFYGNLQNRSSELKNQNIYFGKSKLAVEFNTKDNECTYCNQCMSGCPQNLIYNSKFTVLELLKDKNFKYKKGYCVEKFEESTNGLYIACVKDNKIMKIKADRVYLATGAISSYKIICETYRYYNKNISIKDSAYFIMPFYSFKKLKSMNKTITGSHSLSKIFLSVNLNKFNNATLQLYTLNKEIINAVLEKFKIPKFLNRFFLFFLSKRIILILGYLHSSYSSGMKIKLNKNALMRKIIITPNIESNKSKIIKKIVKKLNACSSFFRGKFISSLLLSGYPGESNHFGGMFPMSNRPTKFKTDIYGRLATSKLIHIVDSTVFPTIPSSTITLSVMANAYRIGDSYDEYK